MIGKGIKMKTTFKNEIREARRRKAEGRPPWSLLDRRIRNPREARAALPYGKAVIPHSGNWVIDRPDGGESPEGRAIYIHIPFCPAICSFCGYIRSVSSGDTETSAYADALKKQIFRWGRTAWAGAAPFRAVYIGGGTPTVLSPDLLTGILEAVRSAFIVDADCEITVESRFQTVGGDYVKQLAEAGVNRMSFGVQSFDTDLRRSLGRTADGRTMIEILERTRSEGVENICIDLMYGLPGQTGEIQREDLKRLQDSPASGCSVYPLIFFENAILSKGIRKSGTDSPADLRKEYEARRLAEEYLTEVIGWEAYSPVQYADPSVDRAVYARARSRRWDILGMGQGAASMLGTTLAMNPVQAEAYLAGQAAGCDQGLAVLKLPEPYVRSRRWRQLSEGSGVDMEAVRGSAPEMDRAVPDLIGAGLVEERDGALKLTETGRFWAGNISAWISEAIAQSIANTPEE